MTDKLMFGLLGYQNSGKSTTWYELFGGFVQTRTTLRELQVGLDEYVEVFVINGSPEETGKTAEFKVGKARDGQPRIILCSMQYIKAVEKTIGFFADNGYEMQVQWLNPGFTPPGWKKTEYDDHLGLRSYIEDRGGAVEKVDANEDIATRVRAIRETIRAWAEPRGIVYGKIK